MLVSWHHYEAVSSHGEYVRVMVPGLPKLRAPAGM